MRLVCSLKVTYCSPLLAWMNTPVAIFFQHKLPEVVYEYCLKSADRKDLLVIYEGVSDRAFSVGVVEF